VPTAGGARDRARRAYQAELDAWLAAGRVPAPPAAPIHRATVRSVMVLAGAMDDDNAIARHKALIDWLVRRGYVATDRRERKRDGASLRWATTPEQVISRSTNPQIIMTVTPADHPASSTSGCTHGAAGL
jgi:hypothetical protein